MRLVDLALAAPLACLLTPFAAAQSSQERSSLRDEIRQIVREEIRAALRDAHAGATAATPTEKSKPGKKVSDHVIHLGQGHGVTDNDAEVGELNVEMEHLGDLLGKLEIVIDGDKVATTHGKTKVAKVKDGGEGAMVFEVAGDDDDKDEAKKPQGLAFSIGGDAKVKSKPTKVKSTRGGDGTMVFEVAGDDDDKDEAKKPQGMTFSTGGDAKAKSKAKKVKSAHGGDGTVVLQMGGDEQGEDNKPMTFSFTEGDEGTMQVIKSHDGVVEMRPMVNGKTQVKKTKKAAATTEGKTMVFQLRCEDGKCTLEPVNGTGDGNNVFVIKSDASDGNAKVQVVGGKKGESKTDCCCSGDSCCDTKPATTAVEGQPLNIRLAEPMELKLENVQPDNIKIDDVKIDTKPIRVRRLQTDTAKDPRNI